MEDWEEAHEAVKADINQLKDQVSQILEALKSLKASGEASSARIEENIHPQVPRYEVQNTQGMSIPFPMYGLPPGYTPPVGEYPEAEQTSFSFPGTNNTLPINTQGPILASTPMTGAGMKETVTFAEPRVTVAPKSPNITVDEDALAKVIPHATAQVVSTGIDGAKSKLEILEERVRAIEGGGSYGFGDVARLSLVPGVMIPHKFKVPEFEKYQGTTCPKSHLTMYGRKMAAYAYDDKLLIHCFQDSLAGVALNWYTHLEPSRIHSWMDLADAFVKQYKYNTDSAPDRLQLQNMAKKDIESFKEYAQRWRELAAQVEPPLLDKEMVATFVNTLQSPFYEHVLGNVSSNFADIIIIGERIEVGLKSGKIAYGPFAAATSKKPGFHPGKKKEVEAHTASVMPMWESRAPTHNYRPHMNQPPYVANAVSVHQTQPQQQGFYQGSNLYQPQHPPNNAWKTEPNSNFSRNAGQNANLRRNQERNFVQFTPIPMTYT